MLKFLNQYAGAIFDLDGTLIDSMHVWDHIARDWLIAGGIDPALIPADMETAFVSMTIAETTAYAIDHFGIPLSQEEIAAQWEAMAFGKYRDTVPLKPGAAELLRALAGRGMKLAIATSCFPACCEAALDRHGIRKYFSAIVYSGEVKRNKSFPDIWLAAASRMDLAPESCVVFEDMYAAIRGVRAAGMGFVAVYDDSCADWPAMQAEADLALRSLGTIRLGPS
ncbi:beta-phosphoglucomutase [Spirochaetia bacterium]|nr:beta-phosphoglucomutase [Spirochaetia bacterium]